MPKATATKKATSSSSKTAPKKGVLGKSFSLRSRKVQFFVTILVIAIVGGGYLTYKSFAATVSYSFTPANDSLVCEGSGCRKLSDADSSKNSVTALEIKSGSYAITATNYTLYSANKYRVCVNVRGIGRVGIAGFVATDGKPTVNLFNVNSSTYQRLCGTEANPKYSPSHDQSSVSVSSGQVLVSGLEVELTSTPSNNPPATK